NGSPAHQSTDGNNVVAGQTYLGSTTVTTDVLGNASFTVDFGTGSLAGEWISASAADQSGNFLEFSTDFQATAAPPSQTFDSPHLQSLLPQSSTTPNAITIQTGANLSQQTVLDAANSLAAQAHPVTITLDLNGGSYDDATISLKANI